MVSGRVSTISLGAPDVSGKMSASLVVSSASVAVSVAVPGVAAEVVEVGPPPNVSSVASGAAHTINNSNWLQRKSFTTTRLKHLRSSMQWTSQA